MNDKIRSIFVDDYMYHIVKHDGITHYIRLESISNTTYGWVIREEKSYVIMDTVYYIE